MIIEQDVLPEVVGAFGVFPETAYWANVREVYRTASVRLAFRAEGLKYSPRTVVLMGARLKVKYPVSRGVRPHQCKMLGTGYCTGRGCKDAPRCRLCGDLNHWTAEHHSRGSTIKCANCNGRKRAREGNGEDSGTDLESPHQKKSLPLSHRYSLPFHAS